MTVAQVNAPAPSDVRVRRLSTHDVQKLLDVGKTPRAKELERLQCVFEGTQYAGRPSFFDDSVPLQERAPCVRYKLAKVGIESNVAFAMGEGRFPTVLSLSSEDDQAFDEDLGLDKKESEVFDSFNRRLLELARLEQAFRNCYRMAQASRSVAVVLGFRTGLPFADLIWSKLCVPSFDDPNEPCRCTKLVIRYRYTEPWRDSLITGGEWWTRVFEYLRVVDESADTVYQPVPVWDVTDAGAVEGQTPVKARTVHGFGLCPVHWYARNRESVVGAESDGHALHDGLCDQLEQIDMALSQRHRAAIYAGDPQTVLSGVDPDEGVGNSGRRAMTDVPPEDLGKNGKPSGQWAGALYGPYGGGGNALRRGVGEVWRLSDPSGKAILLTLPGEAFLALDSNARDIVQKTCDDLGVVIMDPSLFKGAGDLSGRTLAFLFAQQINRVSQDREDMGRCCILPVLNLFYRMLLKRDRGVYLPGLDKVLPILARFSRKVDGLKSNVWFSPHLTLKWGDYFEPSDMDEQTRVQTAIAALTCQTPFITRKTAVEHVRGVFQIGSVDQYVEALDKEADERQAQLHEAMAEFRDNSGAAQGSEAKPASPGGRSPDAAPSRTQPKAPPGGNRAHA